MRSLILMDFYGRYLYITGHASRVQGGATRPMQFYLEDRGGVRHFEGGGARSYRKFFATTVADNSLLGVVEAQGGKFPMQIEGLDELWSMPATVQAVLLPFMLSCRATTVADEEGHPTLNVAFR